MKDEIKEKMTIGKAKKILRGFLAKDCYYDTPLYYAIPYLLDYITNLQEQLHKASLDIQELTERDIWCPSNCDKLTNLQEENERLKENAIHNDKVVDKARWNEMIYKKRINKAIEYIKEIQAFSHTNENQHRDCRELLKILQGSDE